MKNLSEKLSFLKKHEDEVLPLVSDPQTKEALSSVDMSESQVEDTLERFETKIFSFENKNAETGSRIMLEASQPASRTAVEQILSKLSQHRDCKGITLITDNIAGSTFAEAHPEFTPERTVDELLLGDIPHTPDACLVFAEEPINSPSPMLLHSAKSIFGAKKLYLYITDTHISSNASSQFGEQQRRVMDTIDAILVPDEKTQTETATKLKFPVENIIVVGDPAIDKIKQEDQEKFRTEGRHLLNLDDQTTTLFYSGFPSSDYDEICANPELNLQTFSHTLTGMRLAAMQAPEQSFALVVRAHPRDSQKAALLNLLSTPVPKNLKLIDGNSINYQHVIYASDGIACIASSTEHQMGKYRGRKVLLVAYEGKNGSGDVTQAMYGEAPESFTEELYVDVILTSEDIVRTVSTLRPFSPAGLSDSTSSTDTITELLLKK